ncbi:MAG TPA: glycosyltransferase N-terminal domain-containing protein [Flavisolibacter sp.]|nr:glycosyltransferase N-terminal domain-containing protein [Flavisolibacter sp.]
MRLVLPLYDAFIRLYATAIRLAAMGNKKAAAWIEGRKDVFPRLQEKITAGDRVIWMHCSSAGEFEQGKPVLEALKKTYPGKKIVVSFFSPSGYAVAKGYAPADVITYLPLDTRKNAEQFIKLVQPELVIFVKYEFWYHHLSAAAFHHVPILLISAVFRKEQAFFKKYGAFYRQMLFLFRHIFVQDTSSLRLLQDAGVTHCSLAGDTRFDRVARIAEDVSDIPFIEEFTAGEKVLVAGSTWPGDEEALANYLQQNTAVKLIIAPHEINARHIAQVQSHFDGAVLYSSLQTGTGLAGIGAVQTLIIDGVGLLSRLYRYATITYVGGGFTKDGIHNILEAAVWGKPVIFGPNYEKYREGKELIAGGGAFSFTTAAELKKIADDLLTKENHLQERSFNAKNYIAQNTGATGRIMNLIQEKRLLTN